METLVGIVEEVVKRLLIPARFSGSEYRDVTSICERRYFETPLLGEIQIELVENWGYNVLDGGETLVRKGDWIIGITHKGKHSVFTNLEEAEILEQEIPFGSTLCVLAAENPEMDQQFLAFLQTYFETNKYE